MKAAIYQQYGPPEVVQVTEIPKPIPRPDELLIKVYASTVNRTDAGFRSAEYFISRFWSGLFRPKSQVLGSEFAGRVEAIGDQVSSFKVGDAVFGFNDRTFGGHAEYLIVSEKMAIAHMPSTMNFEAAAALTEGAHYALVDIRAAKVKSGQHVLVYGATGAIGSAAVQLMKTRDVHVTAVCATEYVSLVKSLGADIVVDYKTEDFTQLTQRFDFIFDAVGKSTFRQCKPLLIDKGIYISTELGKRGVNIWLALITPLFRGKRLLFPIPTISKDDVIYLKSLAENGLFNPVIDRSYALSEIVEAYHYVESGQKVGNVVLKIADN